MGKKNDNNIAISNISTEANITGNWRSIRPVHGSKKSPCTAYCPIGTDIPSFVDLIRANRFEDGWRLLKHYNPLPGICGRICNHPCMTQCNKHIYGSEIAIPKLERFLADMAKEKGYNLKSSPEIYNNNIAVIGSGPSGLSCAYFLRRLNYQVTLFEAEKELGGILRYGIPLYRLPKDYLDYEISTILDNGITVKKGILIGKDLSLEDLSREFDAVFIGIGAHRPVIYNLNNTNMNNSLNIISGLSYLKNLNQNNEFITGKQVAVIGGGNTAIDVARSLKRSNSEPVVIYRRSREFMPAIISEVKEAEKEGVRFLFNSYPVNISKEGEEILLECIKTSHGDEPNLLKKYHIHKIENSNFFLHVDTLISATGQRPDILPLTGGAKIRLFDKKQLIYIDDNYKTSIDNIFAGGDVITSNRTVANAIASGKYAAFSIDNFLQSNTEVTAITPGPIATVDKLNLYYLKCDKKIAFPHLSTHDRKSGFKETDLPIGIDLAVREASRCWTCGKCIGCDNCILFCPDFAVKKGQGKTNYKINYDYCKGCGICAEECPVSSIIIRKEIK